MENHVGMQVVGEPSEVGYSLDDLRKMRDFLRANGKEAQIFNLSKLLPVNMREVVDNNAYVLIGFKVFDEEFSDALVAEHMELEVDKKYFDSRRQKVLNKQARWNLCFAKEPQEPDYENKKGRIVSFNEVPKTEELAEKIAVLSGDSDLKLEANYYYDLSQCGIGFHGDTERKKVVGVRLGKNHPLTFQWFWQRKPIGSPFSQPLGHGDVYVMSEKAVGFDWKKRKVPTLRHAAGASKFVNVRT